ncbi:MAG: hypothetical protein ACPGRZ_17290, partial [Alphaproteobacteria bacterium]
EHRTENAGVGGSNPPLGTIFPIERKPPNSELVQALVIQRSASRHLLTIAAAILATAMIAPATSTVPRKK